MTADDVAYSSCLPGGPQQTLTYKTKQKRIRNEIFCVID